MSAIRQLFAIKNRRAVK